MCSFWETDSARTVYFYFKKRQNRHYSFFTSSSFILSLLLFFIANFRSIFYILWLLCKQQGLKVEKKKPLPRIELMSPESLSNDDTKAKQQTKFIFSHTVTCFLSDFFFSMTEIFCLYQL